MFHSLFKTLFSVKMEEAGSAEAPAGGAGGGAPAAPAATAAPATTAEPAVTTEPAKPEGKEPAAASVNDNGMQTYIDQHSADNPALGLALGFLRDNGISPTDPAFTAAEVDGDFTLLKAILATKATPGSDAMLGILEKAVGDHQAAIEAHEAQTTQIVTGILGEQSDEILGWARETASPEEKESFNDMFEAGGIYARAAAMLLKDAYVSGGNTVPAKSPVQQAQPAGNAGPLSAREYAEEVQKLAKTMRGDPRNSPEYAQLSRRRAAGRTRGM